MILILTFVTNVGFDSIDLARTEQIKVPTFFQNGFANAQDVPKTRKNCEEMAAEYIKSVKRSLKGDVTVIPSCIGEMPDERE